MTLFKKLGFGFTIFFSGRALYFNTPWGTVFAGNFGIGAFRKVKF